MIYVTQPNYPTNPANEPTSEFSLGVPSKKTNSIFTDIVQIDGDPPPSYPIFDKFIFDTVLIMLTSYSLPPLEKNHEILGFET